MPRRVRLRIVVVIFLALLHGFWNCARVSADPGVVVTRDGSTIEGDVSEVGDEIHVDMHGVKTVIPKSRVAEVRYQGSYDAEFHQRLAKLGEEDAAGRVALAREALQKGKPELSREALEEALRIDPNNKDAYDLLDLVLGQIRLNRAGAAAGAAAATRPSTRVGNATPASRPAGSTAPNGAASERRLISVEDINLIRQQELKPTDAGVRLMFQGDVKRRYAAAHHMTFAEFNRLPPVQQAMAIIENGAPDMRRQVRVGSDPSSLAEYKRAVQPVVLSGCATSACHGGPGGAGLVLFSPADTDPLAYTNFYILQKYTKQMPPPLPALGPVTARLIDRGHGEDSLLVNFGLPPSIAVYDHPLVGGKPLPTVVFRNTEDARYQQIVRWMTDTLKTIEPNYGIDYEIPGAPVRAAPPLPASAPATTQPAGND